MSYTFTKRQTLASSSWSQSFTKSTTGSQLISISETVADSATLSVTMAIDVSAIVGVIMIASVDMAFHCNTSDNAISLLAGQPYEWSTSDYNASKLTVDATAIHVVNSSGGSGTFDMQVVLDATP